MNSTLLLIGAILLASGFAGGWFCYSRVSADSVQEASYSLSHGVVPDGNHWLIGSIAGLLVMLAGMIFLFVALIGVDQIMRWVAGFNEVFG